jgi:hypothetical protein
MSESVTITDEMIERGAAALSRIDQPAYVWPRDVHPNQQQAYREDAETCLRAALDRATPGDAAPAAAPGDALDAAVTPTMVVIDGTTADMAASVLEDVLAEVEQGRRTYGYTGTERHIRRAFNVIEAAMTAARADAERGETER